MGVFLLPPFSPSSSEVGRDTVPSSAHCWKILDGSLESLEGALGTLPGKWIGVFIGKVLMGVDAARLLWTDHVFVRTCVRACVS